MPTAQLNAVPLSPLLGAWQLDISKLPLPPGATPPKSVTLTVVEESPGQWKTMIDTVNADGTAIHAQSIYTLDGKPAPVSGSSDVDVVSVTSPEPSILIMGTSQAGKPSNTRIFTVTLDGKTQIETIVSHRPDGLPATRTNWWKRLK
jgi:hypothetical protein